MQHILVLINIIALCIGTGTMFILFNRLLKEGSAENNWTFFFYLSYSYLVVIAAVTAYLLTNTQSPVQFQVLSGGLTLIGMGILEWAFSGMIFAQAGLVRNKGIKVFVGLCMAGTVSSAFLYWYFSASIPVPFITAAFVFFFAVIGYNVLVGIRSSKSGKKGRQLSKTGILFYALVGAGAAVEIVYSMHTSRIFISVSLPAAYIISSIQFGMAGRNEPGEAWGDLVKTAEEYGLTPREEEMVRLLLDGLSNKEIAYKLGLSQHTVRNHIYNLYQKLGVQKRMDLVRVYKSGPGSAAED